MKIIKSITGQLPEPIAVLSYKRSFFGQHYALWLQNTMRNMKHWSKGEVELMATYVSKNNQCQYCTLNHAIVAKNVFEGQLIQAVMDNVDTAPIDNKMRVILNFLKKLTINPSELTKEDIFPLREQGLSKEAIEEAIHVCGTFNVINRLADAFDFDTSVNPQKAGDFLFKNGYKAASLWR